MAEPSSSSSNDVGTKCKHDDDDVLIVAPKKKPPRQISIDLVSYPHVDNLRGLVERSRRFSRYFNDTARAFSSEVLSYRSALPKAEEKEIPNY